MSRDIYYDGLYMYDGLYILTSINHNRWYVGACKRPCKKKWILWVFLQPEPYDGLWLIIINNHNRWYGFLQILLLLQSLLARKPASPRPAPTSSRWLPLAWRTPPGTPTPTPGRECKGKQWGPSKRSPEMSKRHCNLPCSYNLPLQPFLQDSWKPPIS